MSSACMTPPSMLIAGGPFALADHRFHPKYLRFNNRLPRAGIPALHGRRHLAFGNDELVFTAFPDHRFCRVGDKAARCQWRNVVVSEDLAQRVRRSQTSDRHIAVGAVGNRTCPGASRTTAL